jgi:predicted neuraminidase
MTVITGSSEFIFGDARPFAACHASTLALVPGGACLAAWFGGTAEKHPDTAIWAAQRVGGAWEAPRMVAKVAPLAHWNPVLLAAPGGALQLWFKVGPDPTAWATWVTTSRDGGQSWDAPHELCPGDVGGRGPVKNKPIVASDGAWLAPASREYERRWEVFVDRSDDGGRTWHASPALATDPAITGLGVIQPTLWESAPGVVHMLMRSTAGWICRSDSHDGGRSWTPAVPTGLPNNNSGIDLARLRDGTLVLAYNPVAGNWAARTPLSLAISRDDGATWRRWRDLEAGPGEYSYPAIVADGDAVAVSYTWRRERIAFWAGRVPPAGDS